MCFLTSAATVAGAILLIGDISSVKLSLFCDTVGKLGAVLRLIGEFFLIDEFEIILNLVLICDIRDFFILTEFFKAIQHYKIQ
jgi:hypothetical protein